MSNMRWVRALALSSLSIGASVSTGCLSRPLEQATPHESSTFTEPLLHSNVDKIDLLLMIDDSNSMADKQDILKDAVPDLVRGLVNPPCVHDDGSIVSTPASATDHCPAGSSRVFDPVLDIHIGVISSSLGSHGWAKTYCYSKSESTMGHLLVPTDKNGNATVPTYQNDGFLAWDPKQKDNPPGEATLGDNNSGLLGHVRDLVGGVGEHGCGFESQLESWYRFLVDPTPYRNITANSDFRPAVESDIDLEIIKQRTDFLRPDSLLAIIMLTDENDCSADEAHLGFMTEDGHHLFRPRHECLSNVDDPCCKSCGNPDQGSCPFDPTCTVDGTPSGKIATLSDDEDPPDLRCYHQKQRFGEDFLYPLDRYMKALTSKEVPDREGHPVPNPIFSDLNPKDGNTNVRDPSLVFLAGIVGVPWQDIARQDSTGKPDLFKGLDRNGDPAGGYKDAEQLKANTTGGVTAWDLILGDGANGSDPFMHETRDPRTAGKNPITGDSLTMPPNTNAINGSEHPTGDALQYSCIFKLPTPVPCTDAYCECAKPDGNAVCRDPADGVYKQTRYYAKAYPGLRELEVLKSLDEQGIAASVCPAQLTSNLDKDKDYGYRPAIGAVIERLKQRLANKCLPRPLHPNADNQVACLVLEARKTDDGTCDCTGAARAPVSSIHAPAEQQAASQGDFNCFCEVTQLSGAAEKTCQDDISSNPELNGQPVDGWCYVDQTLGIGNWRLVRDCPPTEKREVRLVGAGHGVPNATLFITCTE